MQYAFGALAASSHIAGPDGTDLVSKPHPL